MMAVGVKTSTAFLLLYVLLTYFLKARKGLPHYLKKELP